MTFVGPSAINETQDSITVGPSAVESAEARVFEWSGKPEVSEFDPFVPSDPIDVIYLYGEVVEGWEINKMLEIRIEEDEDGYYIASDDIFDVYGEGHTKDQAIQDYLISLIDYYELLEHDVREGSSSYTEKLFNCLREHFDRVPSNDS